MRALHKAFEATWAAGGQVDIELDRIREYVGNTPNHLVGIEFKLAINATTANAETIYLQELWGALQNVVLTDIADIEVLRGNGQMLSQLMRCVRGDVEPDDGTHTGDGNADDFVIRARVPFCGGSEGIPGFAFKDFIQPMSRFKDGLLHVDFSAADAITNVTINSATLYVSFEGLPYAPARQGMDIRYKQTTYPDGQKVIFPVHGEAVLAACVANADWDHSDYTVFTEPEMGYMTNVNLFQLVDAFNAACAGTRDDAYLVEASPQIAPLVFPQRDLGANGLVYPSSKWEWEITNTNQATHRIMWAEIHSMQGNGGLPALMTSKAEGIYRGRIPAEPKFMDNNRQSVGGLRRRRLDAILSRELILR